MATVMGRDTETRNPMVYDIMREAGTWLLGEYLVRERAAADPAEKANWREVSYQIEDEMNAVDARDQDAVREATAKFTRLRKALPPLAG